MRFSTLSLKYLIQYPANCCSIIISTQKMPHHHNPSTISFNLNDPRTHLRRISPPYAATCTPYTQVQDYSPLVRYEIEMLPRKLKLRPCKVILVGDCAVGKTAIVNRFCYDKFQSNYKATIGVDFEIENFNILGQNFSLEMWDTAGQERFKCIAGSYYRNASVIVVTYDMSKRETLESAKRWLSSALAHNSSTHPPLIFLVGTKSDLLTKEEFMRMERLATNTAIELKAEYWSVSARSGYKVIEFFQRMASLAFDVIMKQHIASKPLADSTKAATKMKKSDSFDFRKHFNGRILGTDTRSKSNSSSCAC